jgi:N-acetylglucosamine-6-phosphate deacetylase
MSFCLVAPRVVAGRRTLSPGFVRIGGDTVLAVGSGSPSDADVTLPDGVLVPGLVDIQLNGAFGIDFIEATDEQWVEVARRLPATGCTAFVPTFITAPVPALVAALERFRSVRPMLAATPGAARALGVHLEGPFLAARRRGAHREDLLIDPTPESIRALVAAGGDALLYVTLAPERSHAIEAVRLLSLSGVRVAVGHSDATDGVVSQAAEAGATLVTHLYNAQRPFRHRDPGVVGAALTDRRLTLGLIADLHHAEPTAIRLAFAAAAGRVALVTDAVAALGMPAGRYVLGGDVLDLAPGKPPLRPDGTIGGSALRMDQAVANTVRCGIELLTAVEAATQVPADAVGRLDLGRLAAGGAADVVWLSDHLATRAAWVAGRLAYVHPDARTHLASLSESSALESR